MILSIDLGSTHFKAAVYDGSLIPRGRGGRALSCSCRSGGRFEIAADEVLDSLAASVREALRSAGVPPDGLRVVAVTSQAQTFTILDASGDPRIPFISWQDVRASETAAELGGDPGFLAFGEHASFSQLYPNLQLCLLRHVRLTEPDLLAAGDLVCPLPSYVVRHLTGELLIDDNLAAMSGLFSLQLGDWWPRALSCCGISARQLPGVHRIGAAPADTGPSASRLGVSPGLPVVLAGNDQTSGAYGAELETSRAVLLTLGTAQVAYACVDRLSPAAERLIRGPYPGGLFYRMIADSCGGSVVNWARTLLVGGSGYDEFFASAAAAPPRCEGLVFDADVPGGAGQWRNIGLHHTPAHFARSVLESLADRLAGMVRELVGTTSGWTFLAAGGGSRQPVWLRIVEEKLQGEVRAIEAEPLLGAARMARDRVW